MFLKVSANEGEIKLLQDGATMPGRQISPFGPSQSGASLFTGECFGEVLEFSYCLQISFWNSCAMDFVAKPRL